MLMKDVYVIILLLPIVQVEVDINVNVYFVWRSIKHKPVYLFNRGLVVRCSWDTRRIHHKTKTTRELSLVYCYRPSHYICNMKNYDNFDRSHSFFTLFMCSGVIQCGYCWQIMAGFVDMLRYISRIRPFIF